MDRPDEFEGAISIRWPPGQSLRGFLTEIEMNGQPVTTALSLTVRASAEDIIWAELTMFADKDGRPVYDGGPHIKDEQVITGTFPFLVTEMGTISQ